MDAPLFIGNQDLAAAGGAVFERRILSLVPLRRARQLLARRTLPRPSTPRPPPLGHGLKWGRTHAGHCC